MTRITTALVVLACTGPVAAQNAVQWLAEDGGNNHWYAVEYEPECWTAAKESAEQAGGYLVTIADPAENAFIASLAASAGTEIALIGLFQDVNSDEYTEPGGGWTWVSGDIAPYVNWAGGEPNNVGGENFAVMWPTPNSNDPDGVWNDTYDCYPSLNRDLVMEWSADCNDDGIVDYGQIVDGSLIDENANGVPDCCENSTPCFPCPADFLPPAGSVGVDELLYVIGVWGSDDEIGDLNGDGIVEGDDILEVLTAWGACA